MNALLDYTTPSRVWNFDACGAPATLGFETFVVPLDWSNPLVDQFPPFALRKVYLTEDENDQPISRVFIDVAATFILPPFLTQEFRS